MRRRFDKERCRGLRRQSTEAELRLWRYLRAGRFEGWKFRRQHPIGPYFADFYCACARLVVELDGSQHLDASDYDERRSCVMEYFGLRVLRFFNDDVLVRTELVLEEIFEAVEGRR